MGHAASSKKTVQEHFRALLRAELARGGHGAAAVITASTGIKSSHISNLVAHPPLRNPGLDTMHALAKYWGRTYAEIEAEALAGSPQSRQNATPPSPGLAAFLAANPGAEAAIVDLLRAEAHQLREMNLGQDYFADSYDRIKRARDDARRLARAGAFGTSDALESAADAIRSDEPKRGSSPSTLRPLNAPSRSR